MCLYLFLYADNRLTFEATAYYFTESFKLEPNHHVQLSQAPDAPVFAELQVEGGDGVHAATGEATVVYYHILCIHCMPNRSATDTNPNGGRRGKARVPSIPFSHSCILTGNLYSFEH